MDFYFKRNLFRRKNHVKKFTEITSHQKNSIYLSTIKCIRNMSFNSKNPFLSNKRFSSNAVSKAEEVHQAQIIDYNQEMTISGTINKVYLLEEYRPSLKPGFPELLSMQLVQH